MIITQVAVLDQLINVLMKYVRIYKLWCGANYVHSHIGGSGESYFSILSCLLPTAPFRLKSDAEILLQMRKK